MVLSLAVEPSVKVKTGSRDNSFEEFDTDEQVFTDEDLSRVDNTILDLEPEQSGTSAPVTGISSSSTDIIRTAHCI